MPRRLPPASLHAHARASVLVPVNLLGLPASCEALGTTWETRPEFHVTALSTPWLAERHGLPLDHAWAAVAEALEGRRAGPVRVGDELRLVRRGEERSLVVMAHVDGLRDLWLDVAGRLGVPAPEPPTHITLCTRPGGEAIGVHDETLLRDLTRPLRPREAAEVRAGLRLDEVLGPGWRAPAAAAPSHRRDTHWPSPPRAAA